MIKTVSATNDKSQSIDIDLGGQKCVVVITNPYYGNGWYLSVYKDDLPITINRRIDSGNPIIGSNTANGFIGNFIAYPVTNVEQSIGDSPWGITHELMWYDEAF
jgi:hypothetical protein